MREGGSATVTLTGPSGSSTADPVPPGPDEPLEVDELRAAPLPFLMRLAEDYGAISMHTVAGERVYTVHTPDLARAVLRDGHTAFVKTATPDDAMLRPLLGNGLLTSDGAVWEAQRRQCAPAFRPAEITRYDQIITTAAAALVDGWTQRDVVRADHDLMQLTLTVVSSAVLGSDLSGLAGGFGQAVDAANRLMSHHRPGEDDDADARRRQVGFAGARRYLNFLVSTLIETRRLVPHPQPVDLLDSLVAGGQGADDAELRDQVLTIIMAGHETTAKTLTWALHLLHENPDQRLRLEAEVDAVLGGRTPTADDVDRLPVTRAVVCEAMRLYPPVWLISRRCVEPTVVGGYTVPAGALMCISPYVLHRRVQDWPDPERFLPDRFLDGCAVARRPSHSFLPFGGGPRTCIGQHFALLEAVLVLATIAGRLRLETSGDVVAEALVTLRPRDGLTMSVTPRPARTG